MRHFICCLLLIPMAWSAELPDDAAHAIAAFEKDRASIKAKEAADIAKKTEALTKALQKILDRETKAHHSAEALALKNYLEQNSAVPSVGNKPFPEFLKELHVASECYQTVGGNTQVGIAIISTSGYSMKCQRGLNVVAFVGGKPSFEKVYVSGKDFMDFAQDIAALPAGAYVVMALCDAIAQNISECTSAFNSLGAKEGLVGKGRISYLMAGAKGMKAGEAIEMLSPTRVDYPPNEK
jgi:hypothetical protein